MLRMLLLVGSLAGIPSFRLLAQTASGVETTAWFSLFSLLIIFALVLLWSVLPLILCARMAGRKGKSRALWILLAIVFGWIAVLFLAIAAPEK